MTTSFLNRDLSWLSFNGRVLDEASHANVPLLERIRFLSIFSSNLDEFYRVRVPALMLLHNVKSTMDDEHRQLLEQSGNLIQQQQKQFGKILTGMLIPALEENDILLVYNQNIPGTIEHLVKDYFKSEIMTFLELAFLPKKKPSFFPRSNALYMAAICEDRSKTEKIVVVNIPSDKISRFLSVTDNLTQYIIFIDDIIKKYLHLLLPDHLIKGVYNIKITRDAELDLADEYEGDLAKKIERQLSKRDEGQATRFLYEPGISLRNLNQLISALKLSKTDAIEGGHYHNLKDLGNIPIKGNELNYPSIPSVRRDLANDGSIFSSLLKRDEIIHTPYQSYNTVLCFFNEAAVDVNVEEIYVTLYRVAGESKIVNALITAAKNGKKVTVFIELKARFDEENNIRWSKKMKTAGVKIINSIPGLKVHAKVALVKRRQHNRIQYVGLLATGNLNENTACFYTDHILLTSHPEIMRELELLFIFLANRRKPYPGEIAFRHLLVAQFNMLECFLALIDEEIKNASEGKPAGITIKMNNLEEKVLINKLYEASRAGVPINLIVRSICCLEPGVPGMSENIKITRIVDRYLEHGRIFIFSNGGVEKIFIGSADWMNRNVYRRIEVCFPLHDPAIKQEILQIIDLQLKDNLQAVHFTSALDNQPVQNDEFPVRSQSAIYQLLVNKKIIQHEKFN